MTDPGRIPIHVGIGSVPRANVNSTSIPSQDIDQVAQDPLLSLPVGWSDPLTATDGPHYWHRVIASEEARTRRYKRVATIAIAEIVGLDELAVRWGRDAAEGLFVKLARRLAREVRSSDSLAHIERARFGILLTETDEVAAINFVERARAACEAELGLAADVLRIGFGWASLSATDALPTALELAERRLAADLAG